MLLTIVIFVVTLLVLIVSHEFGHFILAKKFGVKVLEFGFGLPPRIFGKKIGETLVSVNLLPIGGFVRLFGEDEVDKKALQAKGFFASQPVGERMAIVVGGVAMNLILAAILFWIILAFQSFKEEIPLLLPYRFMGVNQTDETVVLIGGVAQGSPAETAGLKPGDRVVAVDGTQVGTSDQLINATREKAGEQLNLTVADSQKNQRQITVTPRINPPAGQGSLGIELAMVRIANLNYETTTQKIASGFTHSLNLTAYQLTILYQIVSRSFQTGNFEPVSQSLSGPVGITQIAGAIVHTQNPILPYLNFVALLSLNLAIFNILPFPALDGGRLFFLLIEATFRRKVRAEIERFVHTVGMLLLLGLILILTFSDIRKIFFP